VIGRWRRHHGQALLIVDQLEELFTLNPLELQRRFSELLGRLAFEADVHVLLSMRDDFLLHCGRPDADRGILRPRLRRAGGEAAQTETSRIRPGTRGRLHGHSCHHDALAPE